MIKVAYSEYDNMLIAHVPFTMWTLHKLALKRLGGKGRKGEGCVQVMYPATLGMCERLKTALKDNIDFDCDIWCINEEKAELVGVEARKLHGDHHDWWMSGINIITTPYKHQYSGISWLLHNKHCHLFDPMGLGKSLMVINAACRLRHSRQEKRVIVVCPNSLKEVWASELKKHCWKVFHTLIPGGSTDNRARQVLDWTNSSLNDSKFPWLILNYESLRFFPEAFKAACKDSILVLDEVHRLKSYKSQMTEIVMGGVYGPRTVNGKKVRRSTSLPTYRNRTWGLTGTPIANRAEDAWSIWNLVRPGILGHTFHGFSQKHILRDHWGSVSGYRHTDEIKQALAVVGMGREKDICLGLPGKVYSQRIVELSPEERKAYDMMKEELRAWLQHEGVGDLDGHVAVATAQSFAAKLIRLRQIADGLISEGMGAKQDWSRSLSKIREVMSVWEDSGRKRMVVWCQWVPVIEKFDEVREHVTIWKIHGKTKLEARQAYVECFNTDGGIIIGQMDVLGEGFSLKADLEVFIDAPWTPKQRSQCIDRCEGIGRGTGKTLNIIDILAADTVDAMVLMKLEEKIKVAQELSSKAVPITGKEMWKWVR